MYQEKKIVLEKIKMGLSTSFSREHESAYGFQVSDVDIERLAYQSFLRIHGYIWGQKNKQVEIKTPLNWWEHFKQDCLPDWILERFPVRYEYRIIDSAWVYPNLAINHPEDQTKVWMVLADELIKDDKQQINSFYDF